MLKRMLVLSLVAVASAVPCTVISYRIIWQKNPRSATPLFRFVEGDRIGFIDGSGKIAIPAQFDSDPNETGDFVEGVAKVKKGGRWGYVDTSGRMVVETQFEDFWDLNDFSDGLARVFSSKGREYYYGYIDKSGALAIPFQFHSAEDFSEGLAAFREPDRARTPGNMGFLGRAGYIDKHGAVLIQPRFAFAGPFQEGMARVAVDGKCWINGYAGHLAAPSMPIMNSCGGPAADVTEPCKQGFMDKTGSMVIPARFTAATNFRETLAAVQEDGVWGFIGHDGGYAIRPRFEEAKPFSAGVAAVKLAGRWGFIDHRGDFVIQPEYEFASPFSDGLALVTKDKVQGYIDKSGGWLLNAPVGMAGSFSLGLAHGRIGKGRFGYFDKAGKIVFSYGAPDVINDGGDAPPLPDPPALKVQQPMPALPDILKALPLAGQVKKPE